jgi:hypothetical protein
MHKRIYRFKFQICQQFYECSRKRQYPKFHACSANGSIFTEFLNELGSRLNLHFVLT